MLIWLHQARRVEKLRGSLRLVPVRLSDLSSRLQELGHVDVKKPKRRKSKLDPFRFDIFDWIDKQPDLTLAELCAGLLEKHDLRVGSSTLDDWLRFNQITYKKNGSRQRAGTQ